MKKRELDYKFISEYRRRELEQFCLQYHQFVREGQNEYTEMIEQAAIAADGDLYAYIIKHVTQKGANVRYTNAPCGDRQFYELLRRFYRILSHVRYPPIKKDSHVTFIRL